MNNRGQEKLNCNWHFGCTTDDDGIYNKKMSHGIDPEDMIGSALLLATCSYPTP